VTVVIVICFSSDMRVACHIVLRARFSADRFSKRWW